MIGNPSTQRRLPIRIDTGDGPWAVSVADCPQDKRAYSLYIKTPTHNLTLTRTAREIIELDAKLRDAHDHVPPFPSVMGAATTNTAPAKNKSSFLSTLSRLASTRGRSRKSTTGSATPATSRPASPTKERSDSIHNPETGPPNVTALAAYLTTASNSPTIRQGRVWKRFVRVRADDLESQRVERAIKRVRSDLAVHTGASNMEHTRSTPQSPLKEETEEKKADPDSAAAGQQLSPEAEPKTPVGATPSSRLHRSRSADPESANRLSRMFHAPQSSSFLQDGASSIQDGASSQTDRETGDESSVSRPGSQRRKKKKSTTGESVKRKQRKVVIDDFEMLRVLGKGCAGKVLLVHHKSSSDLFALKAITKRHVLAHQELQHTLTEQAVLKRMAASGTDPFVVKLHYSFHDKENLFLVMDFHPGGDLATQLARWGRLGRDRARFYAAEMVEGVEGLHAAGVIYRDLKPENILIGADGHIVLTDFGLSKEFPRRALPAMVTPADGAKPVSPPWMRIEKGGEFTAGWPMPQNDMTATFCGTAEYLAPEVIQGLPYSYPVDWWSFGTMLYEMLMGITPFWAANNSDMYIRVLQDELHFPDDRAIDQDTKSLLRGLLQKNSALRLSEPRIKRHPYFSMIDWSHVFYKRYIPPYIPPTDPENKGDTQNFDEAFLDMEPVLDEYNEEEDGPSESEQQTDTDVATDTDRDTDRDTTPSVSRSSSVVGGKSTTLVEDDSVDVFDGYSFKGRQSIIIDGDEADDSSEDGTDEDEEEELALRNLGVSPSEPSLAEAVEVEEPKTPEARPLSGLPPSDEDELPPLPDSPVPPTPTELAPDIPEANGHAVHIVDALPAPSEPAVLASKAANRLSQKPRRERSGVEALDKHLSDSGDQEEDDDEWDFVDDAADGEDNNGGPGPKSTSLFARGVVDKYRLAVFRKGPTPPQSPPPAEKRGRNQLTFRRPRQFLKPKSPPSSYSGKASMGRSMTPASLASSLMGAASSTVGSSQATTPSLRSKDSDPGALNQSDQSPSQSQTLPPQSQTLSRSQLSQSQSDVGDMSTMSTSTNGVNKKLKKYREGAEKVFSLFAPSPRSASVTQPRKLLRGSSLKRPSSASPPDQTSP
ncbi:kinase-like protein [Cylindrobasidium torrendii FP15055 ss-10]|uniref:Kinase-like protein n=1 Tax=Cylindrobasidium torrendii FP15055 ss-10 TaxID=1314674 RepID=A0A0D7AUE8_9AGAR|nr:kinase-like protein [Cylindrobasidium torrendii FP15055 ss-10]